VSVPSSRPPIPSAGARRQRPLVALQLPSLASYSPTQRGVSLAPRSSSPATTRRRPRLQAFALRRSAASGTSATSLSSSLTPATSAWTPPCSWSLRLRSLQEQPRPRSVLVSAQLTREQVLRPWSTSSHLCRFPPSASRWRASCQAPHRQCSPSFSCDSPTFASDPRAVACLRPWRQGLISLVTSSRLHSSSTGSAKLLHRCPSPCNHPRSRVAPHLFSRQVSSLATSYQMPLGGSS
jgi:hypothetical protein